MARNSLKNVMRLIDTAQKTSPPEVSFLADLKRSIELTDEKSGREPSRTYKPSGMNCMRQSFYQLVGKEQDEAHSSYVLVGICNSGTDIHERTQKAVADMINNGIDCEYIDVADFVKQRELNDIIVKSKQGMETKLYHTKYNMSFLCDGIIRYHGHYYILELKTETAYKWQSRDGVDPAHYNQATAYSLAFGLPEVLFVYINRDILDMKAFMFTVTDEMRSGLVNYIAKCDEFVRQGVVPPKSDTVVKKACEYCGYKSQCRRDV